MTCTRTYPNKTQIIDRLNRVKHYLTDLQDVYIVDIAHTELRQFVGGFSPFFITVACALDYAMDHPDLVEHWLMAGRVQSLIDRVTGYLSKSPDNPNYIWNLIINELEEIIRLL